jgi:hypothetical protein
MFKSLRKMIDSSDDPDYTDEFMNEYLATISIPVDENENTGFVSYSTPFIYPARVPFHVQRGHNQVGMKVWNAGLYLIEVFYCLLCLSIEGSSRIEDIYKLWFSQRTILELGAGVGMTGIMVERGLFLPLFAALRALDSQSVGDYCLPKMILTDYCEEIARSMQFNIRLSEEPPARSLANPFAEKPPCSLPSHLETLQQLEKVKYDCSVRREMEELRRVGQLQSLVLDWKEYDQRQLTAQPIHCIFAGDCTYSEDLNLSLIAVFEDYIAHNCLNRLSRQLVAGIEGSSLSLPLRLLAADIPFVLIACTVRNRDTFAHFRAHLARSPLLRGVDLTEEVSRARDRFPYLPPFYYDSHSSTDIQLLCVVSKSIPTEP